MSFKVNALEMFQSPNHFKNGSWEIISGNQIRLWMILEIEDSLGERRYIPAAGSLLKVEFPRARSTVASSPMAQTISKNAIQIPEDKSMFYIDLNSTDTQGIISGTVKFSLTENGITNSWLQNYFISRKSTTPGN